MAGIGADQEVFGLRSERRGRAEHLLLSGELDTATSPVLDGWLQTAERNGNSTIVVDLENVTFIDVGGLRPFIRAADRAVRSGRGFALVKAPAMVRKVLQITGTTHLLGSDALPFRSDRMAASA